MKLTCLTQKPIQTLILIYLLAKYDIFFDKIFYFKKNKTQNFNKNDEGEECFHSLNYQCKILKIKLIQLTVKNQLQALKHLQKNQNNYGISLISDFILDSKIIKKFKGGIFSTHAGILPMFRGVDTNKWAILNGNRFVGITLFKLDEGVDTGKIIKVIKCNYKKKFRKISEINKYLYYKHKLYLFVDLLKKIKKGEKIKFQLQKKKYPQFYKMTRTKTNLVKNLIRN